MKYLLLFFKYYLSKKKGGGRGVAEGQKSAKYLKFKNNTQTTANSLLPWLLHFFFFAHFSGPVKLNKQVLETL